MTKEYPSLLNLKCVTDESLYDKDRTQEFRDMLSKLRMARLRAMQDALQDKPVHIPFDIVKHLGSRTIPITLDSMQSAKVTAEHYKGLFAKSQDYVQRVEYDRDEGITFWGEPQHVGGKSAFLAKEILKRGLSFNAITMNPNPRSAYRDFSSMLNIGINIWDEVPQKLIDSAGFLNHVMKSTRQLSELSLAIKYSCNLSTDEELESPIVLEVKNHNLTYNNWGGGGGGRSHVIEFKHRRGSPLKGK